MDPQRLLGSLLSGVMGRRSLPRQTTMAVGMGALGLAIAAWEHFSQQKGAGASPPPLPPGEAPPLPTRSLAGGPQPGPPAPLGPPSPPPLPSPPAAFTEVAASSTSYGRGAREAALLVRAMAAAAWADGVVDEEERAAIRDRLATSGLSEEEQAHFLAELATPPRLGELIPKVDSPQLAEQVYLVSLLATRADTAAEREYLKGLASRLALDPGTVQRLHLLVGVRM
ncbi:MAG TPA: DUF533 domain-containing protein [Thermoanaerobaculaceae bacterium]|nr:DUF533 domain-containing protein [Thermoanaerobaculaceae bacterium]